MYLPKSDVYNALKDITPNVLQGSQKTIVDIPAITFYVSDNAAELNLSNEIARQDIEVTIDVWAKNSSAADTLLSQVEAKMRELGYRLSFSMDVPDPQNICHINSRFIGIK